MNGCSVGCSVGTIADKKRGCFSTTSFFITNLSAGASRYKLPVISLRGYILGQCPFSNTCQCSPQINIWYLFRTTFFTMLFLLISKSKWKFSMLSLSNILVNDWFLFITYIPIQVKIIRMAWFYKWKNMWCIS